jgi:hypothetical protein
MKYKDTYTITHNKAKNGCFLLLQIIPSYIHIVTSTVSLPHFLSIAIWTVWVKLSKIVTMGAEVEHRRVVLKHVLSAVTMMHLYM